MSVDFELPDQIIFSFMWNVTVKGEICPDKKVHYQETSVQEKYRTQVQYSFAQYIGIHNSINVLFKNNRMHVQFWSSEYVGMDC
jgi:hypothetical protein